MNDIIRLPRPATPPQHEDFHTDWEAVQAALGDVLRAYYAYPRDFESAVYAAAAAVLALEVHQPKGDRP